MELAPPNERPCAIGLAARIHERVVPRLSAVGLVLGVEGDLPDELRRRCRDELAAGLMELRAALLEPASRQDDVPSLAREIRRWREGGVQLQLTPGADALVPPELQALACLVLNEAVRNAVRHSTSSVVHVRVIREAETLTLSVVSEGPFRSPDEERVGLGVGLSLAAAAADKHDGILEWGPLEVEQWRVQLTAPIPSR